MRLLFSVLLLVSLSTARAGTADTPEISDPAHDCALPYGNAYLDATSAWVDDEDADSFDVHLRLAGWDAHLAEGAGYAVQFTHQGLTWGVVAFHSPAFEGGWIFWTGQATLDSTEGFEDAAGSFDASTSTIAITVPKAIFPHVDASDDALRGFTLMTVDVRPAYPFILAEEAGTDPDGHYVLCDDATSDAVYTFANGAHSTAHAHDPAQTGTDEAAQAPEPVAPAAVAGPPAATKSETPWPSPSLALALATALLIRRSRDRP